MNASLRIGVMALMVLGIFSGVALADPIQGGGDAGYTQGSASPIYPSILVGEWTVYNGYLYDGDIDWYRLNTQSGQILSYDLDISDRNIVRQQIYNSAGTKIGDDDYGTVTVSGTTYSKDYVLPNKGPTDNYMFAMVLN